MKKIFKLTLAVFIVLMVFLALTSCSEQQQAARVLNKLDDILENADSFYIDNTTVVTGLSGSKQLTYTQTTTQDVMGKKGDTFSAGSVKVLYHYDYDKDSYDHYNALTWGYNEEYMYRHALINNTEIKIKSAVTEENKRDFLKELLQDTSISSENLSYTKEDDGSIIIKISNLGPSLVNTIGMSVTAITPGYRIAGAEATITVSPDYSEWVSRVDYTFEPIVGNSNANYYTAAVSSVTTFNGINCTKVEEVDLDDYRECDDVGIINRVSSDLIGKMNFARSGASLKIVGSVNHQYVHATAKEMNTIIYGTNDSGFYYNIDSISGKNKKEIDYSKGVKNNGDVAKNSSDSAERAYIFSLLTGGAFNELLVCDVKKIESLPDTYVMEIYLGDGQEDPETADTLKIFVTYEDGFLSYMEFSTQGDVSVQGITFSSHVKYEIEYFMPTE